MEAGQYFVIKPAVLLEQMGVANSCGECTKRRVAKDGSTSSVVISRDGDHLVAETSMECPRPLYVDGGPFGSGKSAACVTQRAQSGSSCSSKVDSRHIPIDQRKMAGSSLCGHSKVDKVSSHCLQSRHWNDRIRFVLAAMFWSGRPVEHANSRAQSGSSSSNQEDDEYILTHQRRWQHSPCVNRV